jgi:hypothetical protein
MTGDKAPSWDDLLSKPMSKEEWLVRCEWQAAEACAEFEANIRALDGRLTQFWCDLAALDADANHLADHGRHVLAADASLLVALLRKEGPLDTDDKQSIANLLLRVSRMALMISGKRATLEKFAVLCERDKGRSKARGRQKSNHRMRQLALADAVHAAALSRNLQIRKSAKFARIVASLLPAGFERLSVSTLRRAANLALLMHGQPEKK